MIHVYYGDGKGKTTAALGLGLRARGQGMRVTLAQFLKSEGSGERQADFDCLPIPHALKFVWDMSPDERAEYAAFAQNLFAQACAAQTDVLILDELCAAIALGFVQEEAVLAYLDAHQNAPEIVITGRDPSEALLSRTDYATQMLCVKHPYEKGIQARRGIEF